MAAPSSHIVKFNGRKILLYEADPRRPLAVDKLPGVDLAVGFLPDGTAQVTKAKHGYEEQA